MLLAAYAKVSMLHAGLGDRQVGWQTSLLRQDFSLFNNLLLHGDPTGGGPHAGRRPLPGGVAGPGGVGAGRDMVQFTDTSFIETVVFSRRAGALGLP